jgi:hypothetical protein
VSADVITRPARISDKRTILVATINVGGVGRASRAQQRNDRRGGECLVHVSIPKVPTFTDRQDKLIRTKFWPFIPSLIRDCAIHCSRPCANKSNDVTKLLRSDFTVRYQLFLLEGYSASGKVRSGFPEKTREKTKT